MIKRFVITILISFVMCMSFLIGYRQVLSVPVYADSTSSVPNGYSPCGLNDQVDAFRSYCKSRNLFIEGSALDTITSVTSSIYQHLVADAGLDINQLQNEIYKRTDGNAGAQWFFTTTGISAYNRLFAEFLQNNNLSVGDSVENNNLYNGSSYNGNAIYIFSYNANAGVLAYTISSSNVTKGTLYPHTAQYYISAANSDKSITQRQYSINLPDGSFNHIVYSTVNNDVVNSVRANSYTGTYAGWYYRTNYEYTALGDCIFYNQANQTFYWGTLGLESGNYYFRGQHRIATDSENEIVPANIYYTTNNTTINNNNYEGDTYITNEGDVIVNPTPIEPSNPNDTITNIPENPISQDPDSGDWHIDLPDLDIPNLPLGNLSEKFPFSIPWDLVAFYAMMDAEPEAPRFNGTMDLWVIDWDYDIDLSSFDSVAELCRKLQFGLFIVGLIVATRDLIRG